MLCGPEAIEKGRHEEEVESPVLFMCGNILTMGRPVEYLTTGSFFAERFTITVKSFEWSRAQFHA